MSSTQPLAEATQAAPRRSCADPDLSCCLGQGMPGEEQLEQPAVGCAESSQQLQHAKLGLMVVRRRVHRRWREEWAARPEPLKTANGAAQATRKMSKKEAGKALLARPIGQECTEDQIALVTHIVQLGETHPGAPRQRRTDAVQVGTKALIKAVAQVAVATLGQAG